MRLTELPVRCMQLVSVILGAGMAAMSSYTFPATRSGGRMNRLCRIALLLLLSTIALLGARSAVADPPGSSPPRPGQGPDEHSQNMKRLAFLPKAGVTNSDIAFWGNLAYQGNYAGFRVIDISDPSAPA